MRGRIGRSIYLGEVAEYDFQPGTNGAKALKILEMNPRFVETSNDTEVTAGVAPEDVIVLHP